MHLYSITLLVFYGDFFFFFKFTTQAYTVRNILIAIAFYMGNKRVYVIILLEHLAWPFRPERSRIKKRERTGVLDFTGKKRMRGGKKK